MVFIFQFLFQYYCIYLKLIMFFYVFYETNIIYNTVLLLKMNKLYENSKIYGFLMFMFL